MAESIRDKVAVVGVGACKFGENWNSSREDMIVDAAYEAYEDAGIDDPQSRIEAIFCGAVYPREGSAEIAEALKIYGHRLGLLPDRHRRLPLRRVLGGLRDVRHRARRGLRQAQGSRRLGPLGELRSRARSARDSGRMVLAVRGALLRATERSPPSRCSSARSASTTC
jgi:hypothetical protein